MIDSVPSNFVTQSLLKDTLHEFVPEEKEIEENKTQNNSTVLPSETSPQLMDADQVSLGETETGAPSL
jgi:hypothetical protein